MMHSIFNLLVFSLLLIISGCEDDTPQQEKLYRFQGSLTIDGLPRSYVLNLPPGYYDDTTSDFPLVIGLHGTGGSANQFESDYRFTEFANESKFIAVYPEGIRSNGILGLRTWNAGKCCDYALERQVDDVKFIRELIDELVSFYNVDPKRVYVTGMSNGGMMAYRLACEIPNKIAAIAAVSCSMVASQPCHPERAVPVLHIHSILDAKIPHKGGIGIGGYYFPPVDSVLRAWSSENGCSNAEPVIVHQQGYDFLKWSPCDENATIEYYLTQDGGHAWPGGLKSRSAADTPSEVIDANALSWEFFQRFELP